VNIIIVSKIPLFPTIGGNRARILTMAKSLIEQGAGVSFLLIPSRQSKSIDVDAHEALLGSKNFRVMHLNYIHQFRYNLHLLLIKKRVRGRIRAIASSILRAASLT
jgi:glycosyltransferase involved in cell wall biosynthesis